MNNYKTCKTHRGFPMIKFLDRYGVECTIQESSIATDFCVWFGTDDLDPRKLIEGKGWTKVELPEIDPEILLNTRMHLDRTQLAEVTNILLHIINTWKVEIPGDDNATAIMINTETMAENRELVDRVDLLEEALVNLGFDLEDL